MPVVSTLIMRGLRLIGEKQRGGSLTADESTECLATLQSMIASWATERLMCYTLRQESRALTASVASTTIGPSATWNTDRPIKIVDPCFIRDSDDFDTPLKLIDAIAYGRIGLKSLDATYPNWLYYDPDFTASSGVIYLNPEPGANLTLFINSWRQLPTFSTVSMTVNLPPGYQRAIEFNYAIEEAGGFAQVDPWVMQIAKESKAAIKRVNLPTYVARMDVGIVRPARPGNIFTGP